MTATSLILGAVKDVGFSARTLAETGLTANTSFAAKPEKGSRRHLPRDRQGHGRDRRNPGSGRLLKALTDCFPGMGLVINRLSRADKLVAGVAEHREAARCPQDRRRDRACRRAVIRCGPDSPRNFGATSPEAVTTTAPPRRECARRGLDSIPRQTGRMKPCKTP